MIASAYEGASRESGDQRMVRNALTKEESFAANLLGGLCLFSEELNPTTNERIFMGDVLKFRNFCVIS